MIEGCSECFHRFRQALFVRPGTASAIVFQDSVFSPSSEGGMVRNAIANRVVGRVRTFLNRSNKFLILRIRPRLSWRALLGHERTSGTTQVVD